jgi:hypothetical protein
MHILLYACQDVSVQLNRLVIMVIHFTILFLNCHSFHVTQEAHVSPAVAMVMKSGILRWAERITRMTDLNCLQNFSEQISWKAAN